MTGTEFHELLLTKWGRSYDVQLRRTQGKIFAQIMWKFLGQASYPRSQEAHIEHLEEVGNYIQALGAADRFRASVMNAKGRPRIGKAISIVLDVDLDDRACSSAAWRNCDRNRPPWLTLASKPFSPLTR